MTEQETVTGGWVTGNRTLDILLIPVVVSFVLPLLRGQLRRHVFEPIGDRVLTSVAKKTDAARSPEQHAAAISKWNESCWKLLTYISFSAGALFVAYDKPWLTNTTEYWAGATTLPLNHYVPSSVAWFYYIETGFYLQAVPFLVFVETRRKDWLESMLHHLVTLALLYYSFYTNFMRAGLITMLLHDMSDIFLEAAKLARYADRQGAALWLFVAFTLSWIVCRLILFPTQVVHSCLTEPVELVAMPHGIDPQPHYAAFSTLFLVLFFLHLYWTYFIILVIVKQLKTGDTTDVREEDDD